MNKSQRTYSGQSQPLKQLSFAISYGFVGGPAQSRHFRNVATAAGLTTATIQEADIIIAHSAGCWLLPTDIKPKLVVYVGMPLTMARTQKAWLTANINSFRHGSVLQNLKTRLHNSYYMVRQPLRNIDIMRHPKIGQPVVFKGVPALFIANRYDPWPDTDTLPEFIAAHDWCYLSMPGTHDNLWEEPDKYIAIIKAYADGLLEQTGK